MSTIESAKHFAEVALLRQKALVYQAAQRAIAGALAIAALLVAAGLGTFALFLAIRPAIGDLNAVLLIGGAYAVIGAGLLFYALHPSASAEVQALTAKETEARENVTSDARGVVQAFDQAKQGVQNISTIVSVGVAVISAIRKLLARKDPAKGETRNQPSASLSAAAADDAPAAT